MFPSKSFLVLRWMIASRCSRPKRITKISCIAMCFGVYDFTISILNRESTPPRPLPRNYPINGIVRSTIGPRANYWFDFSTSWTSRERERERGRSLSRQVDPSRVQVSGKHKRSWAHTPCNRTVETLWRLCWTWRYRCAGKKALEIP